MKEFLSVGIGSFVGGVSRYYLSTYTTQVFPLLKFPLGTLLVNIIGCFLIGILASLLNQNQLTEQHKLLLITGFLGGFTTFSAFGLETFTLIKSDNLALAFVNILASVSLSILAVYLGFRISSSFSS